MDRAYFTGKTIDSRTLRFMAELKRARLLRASTFRPEDAALLVVDMQKYFLDPDSHACAASAAAVVPRIEALVQAFRACRLPVLFTRHLNTPEKAGNMGIWWGDLIDPKSPLSRIAEPFMPEDGEMVIKSRYDAFWGTDLESRLRGRGVGRLVVTGVLTHLCCETTARSAFIRDFRVYFPADGTATYDEGHHRAALLNLAHGFAEVTTVNRILDALGKGDRK